MSKKKITCPKCKSNNIELIEIKGRFSTHKCLECKKEFNIRVFIQVSLSKEEKDKIQKLAKEKHTTASNFCREAIFEYIRRIENPDMFNQQSNVQFNPIILEQLTQNTQKILELQKLTLERTGMFNEMNKTLDLIQQYSIKTDLKNEKYIVINLFKSHKSLTPKEIIDKTDLNQKIVFTIISELQKEKVISLTTTGRFKLRNE